MQIVQAPNPVLSQVAKPVKKIDTEILKLIEDMKKTLLQTTDPKGIGLAAPQVGISLQLFIIKEEDNAPFSIFINPKVILLPAVLPAGVKEHVEKEDSKPNPKRRKVKNQRLEGCLSLKDIWGQVKRSPKVKIMYMNGNEKTCTKIFGGFFSTIIQHEYDHLQGILFPKRTLEQKGQLYKTQKDEKGEEVFEEIEI